MENIEILKSTANALNNKKGKNLQIIKVGDLTILAHYFVLASGTSSTQVKALTGTVREKIKELFERIPHGSENDEKNRWNLLDYGEIVVHIMHEEQRETYALEKFWNHALKLSRETWEKESEEYKVY